MIQNSGSTGVKYGIYSNKLQSFPLVIEHRMVKEGTRIHWHLLPLLI